jgi:hypothetical protein
MSGTRFVRHLTKYKTCGKVVEKGDKDYCEDHLPLKTSGNIKLNESGEKKIGNQTDSSKAQPTISSSEIEGIHQNHFLSRNVF